jgi:transposase
MNASKLVPDDLWEAIEPLLPHEPLKPTGGRPRIPARAALGGIVFVLRTGCPWRLLPKELGCGSGTTCWRRLRDWQAVGVWERLHETLLNWLGNAAAIDWHRASVDSLSVRAKRGASRLGRTRSTVASSAPSTIWSSTAMASPWPCPSRQPTCTTRPNSCPLLTPSLRSSDHEENQAGPASVLPSCTPIKPTTPQPCAARSGRGASRLGLLAAGSSQATGSDDTGGWWSGHCPGYSAIAASVCATNGRQISCKGCCTWPVP